MPYVPYSYRGRSGAARIQVWLQRGCREQIRFGNLKFQVNGRSGIAEIYSYRTLLAVIESNARVAHVNVVSQSVTQSTHRNRVLRALEAEGYSVTEIEGAQILGDVREALLFPDTRDRRAQKRAA